MAADGLNADFLGAARYSAVDTMLADGLAVQIDIHPEEHVQAGHPHRQRRGRSLRDAVAQAGRALRRHAIPT